MMVWREVQRHLVSDILVSIPTISCLAYSLLTDDQKWRSLEGLTTGLLLLCLLFVLFSLFLFDLFDLVLFLLHLLLLALVMRQYLFGLSSLLLCEGDGIGMFRERGQPCGEVDQLIVSCGLGDHLVMHLPEDDGCALAGHVAGADTVLHSVGRVGTFLHAADAATRKRNDEGTITETVKLTAEGQPAIRDQSQCVYGLFEANGIIEVLRESFSAIVIDIDGSGVEEIRLHDAILDQWSLHIPQPGWGGSHISAHSCGHIGGGLCQLAPRPHIPIAEEELGPLDAIAHDGGLHGHLQKLIYIGCDVLLKAARSVYNVFPQKYCNSYSEKKSWKLVTPTLRSGKSFLQSAKLSGMLSAQKKYSIFLQVRSPRFSRVIFSTRSKAKESLVEMQQMGILRLFYQRPIFSRPSRSRTTSAVPMGTPAAHIYRPSKPFISESKAERLKRGPEVIGHDNYARLLMDAPILSSPSAFMMSAYLWRGLASSKRSLMTSMALFCRCSSQEWMMALSRFFPVPSWLFHWAQCTYIQNLRDMVNTVRLFFNSRMNYSQTSLHCFLSSHGDSSFFSSQTAQTHSAASSLEVFTDLTERVSSASSSCMLLRKSFLPLVLRLARMPNLKQQLANCCQTASSLSGHSSCMRTSMNTPSLKSGQRPDSPLTQMTLPRGRPKSRSRMWSSVVRMTGSHLFWERWMSCSMREWQRCRSSGVQEQEVEHWKTSGGSGSQGKPWTDSLGFMQETPHVLGRDRVDCFFFMKWARPRRFSFPWRYSYPPSASSSRLDLF